MNEEEYLQGETESDVKNEYIDGQVYAMASASRNHVLITGNIFREISGFLKQKNSPCRTFSSDMKVRSSNVFSGSDYFYPDVMVVCDPDDEETHRTNSPVLIVEVLSPSNYGFRHRVAFM